jgi:hypothetical protein
VRCEKSSLDELRLPYAIEASCKNACHEGERPATRHGIALASYVCRKKSDAW